MIEFCPECRAKFFQNPDSQKYAKAHLGYCRGIMTKDPEEYRMIIGYSKNEEKRTE